MNVSGKEKNNKNNNNNFISREIILEYNFLIGADNKHLIVFLIMNFVLCGVS